MINSAPISYPRNTYIVKTNDLKYNNQPLNNTDYMNVGYMAGRFGVNLSNNPLEQNPMIHTSQGTIVNINSCTADLFEKTLADSGIKFNIIV